MADKNGKNGSTNGTTNKATSPGDQSAANNNMPNNNNNAKISNGPGMMEKTPQGVEFATSEARTSQIAVSFYFKTDF